MACRLCVSDTFSTQQNTTTPKGGGVVAELQPQLCGVFWAVQLESGEGWLSGERHTGPNLGLAVWHYALQLARRQTVKPWLSTSALETVPSARGARGG